MHRQSKRCRACYRHSGKYVIRSCKRCDDKFRVHQSQTRDGEGIYCSRSCARSGSRTKPRLRIVVSCSLCCAKIERRPCEIRRSITKFHFCCSSHWYEFISGPAHWAWSGGKSERGLRRYRRWRQTVIRRDGGICRLCKSGKNVEAHHIKPWRLFPSLRFKTDNGLALCRACHRPMAGHEAEYAEALAPLAMAA